jgi:hypothetical protein
VRNMIVQYFENKRNTEALRVLAEILSMTKAERVKLGLVSEKGIGALWAEYLQKTTDAQ